MHELFRRHDPGAGHPERPARYDAIVAAVAGTGARRAEAPSAGPDDLERVHTPMYLELLERFCASGGGALDADTVVRAVSWDAAVHAAGAAIAAVRDVIASPRTSAVACGRPPGHHAESARAMGFCIINNAAVAAAYARDVMGVDRVAVLDWDAHHGNGTQAIFYDDPAVLYVSLHQYPFYPGTGAESERGGGAGEGTTVNVPLAAGTDEATYMSAFRDRALPALRAFEPEVVVVSAGFDAHRDDPLCNLGLSSEAFGAMAEEVCALRGGAAFVVEGGYDLRAIEESLGAVLRAASP
jgi:acetoin utilization deacetylase AcuC-like enzyme